MSLSDHPFRTKPPEAKRLREEGLTFAEIARQLGTTPSTARRWATDYEPAPRQKAYYVVDEATGCWVWQRLTSDGYGGICLPGRHEVRAHRFMYEQNVGPVPEGLVLDHVCGNRPCVNPEHLEPVPQQLNVQRGRGVKLNPRLVVEIRDLAGVMSFTEIGRHYGLTWGAVQKVVERRSWANVE